MGVQSSVEVVEEIQVCCRKLDLWRWKKSFPDESRSLPK
jgi:hypothetical protein